MDISIEEFDPKTASQDEFENFHRYRHQRHMEASPDDEYTPDEVVNNVLKQDNPMAKQIRYLVYSTGQVIGSLTIGWLKEGTESYENNKHLLQASAGVLKAYQRQGIGTELLRMVHQKMVDMDKSLMLTGTSEDTGRKFLEKIGAEMALEGNENRLQMADVDWTMVEAWVKEAETKNSHTKLVAFDSMPEIYLERFAELITEVQNEQPLDDLDVNEIIMTPEQLQQQIEMFEKIGALMMTVVTEEKDGAISSMTQILKVPGQNSLNQQFTGVQLNHRGRGLGKWVKAAMLLNIRDRFPDTTFISTDNANSNAPMLSINTRLGFKAHKASVNAQIKREKLEEFLKTVIVQES